MLDIYLRSAIILFLLVSPAYARGTRVPLIGGSTDTIPILTSSGLEYNSLLNSGNLSWSTSTTNGRSIIPTNGVLMQLRAYPSATPGAGNTIDVDVVKSGSQTLTCSYTNPINIPPLAACTDNSSVAVTAGEDIQLRYDYIVGSNTHKLNYVVYFVPDNDGEYIWLGGGGRARLSGTTTYYINPNGQQADSVIFDAEFISASDGKIKNLYVELDGSPGFGKSYLFEVLINGSEPADNVECTISSGFTVCNDTVSAAATIAAGDKVTVRSTPTNIPTSRTAYVGLVFIPSARSELPYGSTTDDTAATGSSEYGSAAGGDFAWGATESDFYNNSGAVTVIQTYHEADTAPGSGKSWANQLRVEGSTSLCTGCTISGTGTTCNATC